MYMHTTYEEVLAEAQLLSDEDQARLVEELVAALRRRIANQEYHSIMELKGLGKDFWREIDVDKYIEEERNSWHG